MIKRIISTLYNFKVKTKFITPSISLSIFCYCLHYCT